MFKSRKLIGKRKSGLRTDRMVTASTIVVSYVPKNGGSTSTTGRTRRKRKESLKLCHEGRSSYSRLHGRSCRARNIFQSWLLCCCSFSLCSCVALPWVFRSHYETPLGQDHRLDHLFSACDCGRGDLCGFSIHYQLESTHLLTLVLQWALFRYPQAAVDTACRCARVSTVVR